MREILFKAKRVIDGEWIYGNFLRTDDGAFIIQNYVPFEGIGKYMVAPETLCQYTGLPDKNGKMIWENDIVKVRHEKYPETLDTELDLFPTATVYTRNYAVEFINTGSSYGYRCRNRSIHFLITKNTIYNHEVEVIGNIFDNPELLGGAE